MTNPINRQQVLDATDEQLNEWAATVVMGWKRDSMPLLTGWLGYNPESRRYEWTGVLAEPLAAEMEGMEQFMGNKLYLPATDIAQAMELLEALPKYSFHLRRVCGEWGCELVSEEDNVYWSRGGSNLPRAITQAAIMVRAGL